MDKYGVNKVILKAGKSSRSSFVKTTQIIAFRRVLIK